MKRTAAILACSLGLWAWSPRFHEVQTKLAARMVPAPLAAMLHGQREVLLTAGRGQSSDEPPTVEAVADHFERIVALSERGATPRQLARELGTLAHEVQVLLDPGATHGLTALRSAFTTYGDEQLGRMVLARRTPGAVAGPLDPRSRIQAWTRAKFDRHNQLLEHFDGEREARLGVWDELSVPFALLQLSFDDGVHATADLWILLWRAVGDRWPVPVEAGWR